MLAEYLVIEDEKGTVLLTYDFSLSSQGTPKFEALRGKNSYMRPR